MNPETLPSARLEGWVAVGPPPHQHRDQDEGGPGVGVAAPLEHVPLDRRDTWFVRPNPDAASGRWGGVSLVLPRLPHPTS